MRLSSRVVAAGLGVVSLLFLGTLPLAAQQAPPGSSTKTEAPAAKSISTTPRRVPNYFGQLGLSPEQKDSIYKVVAKHQSRIDELKKELAEANDKMVQECESLLDDAQKKSLEARRTAAADAAKAKAAAKAAKSKEDKKSD
jgi:Spy/CpxP family protein refolding chaperone